MTKNTKQISGIAPKVLGITFMVLLFFGLFLNCTSHKVIKLSYLDSYQIPANARISETVFGGISGIDYNETDDNYYLITDDRSKHNPARMYIAKINLTFGSIDTVYISSVIYFLNQNKLPYDLETVDMESVRYNPKTKLFVVGDEGGQKGKSAIKMFGLNGQIKDEIEIDSNYIKHIRTNKSFEGLSFSQDYKSLYYSTEGPLILDGTEPSQKNKGLLRIIGRDNTSAEKTSEFLYWLEKIPQKSETKPPWNGSGSDNGLSELIALSNQQFLTLERSGAYQKDGSFKFICKVFQVFPRNKKRSATMKTQKTRKKEVFNFSILPDGNFNIEGMTFGPSLNGKQTLLFISDNNFEENIPTKLYLFQTNISAYE